MLGIFFDNALVNKFHISVAYRIMLFRGYSVDLKVLPPPTGVQVILNGSSSQHIIAPSRDSDFVGF